MVPEKDEQGRRFFKFLIHFQVSVFITFLTYLRYSYVRNFQGWNSTWDRYVTDEFILKDTEENRILQKELAEEAQLTPLVIIIIRLSCCYLNVETLLLFQRREFVQKRSKKKSENRI